VTGIIHAMGRRSLAWLSALPLAAAGSLLAHALAYRLADPEPSRRAAVLDATGHAYLAYAPAALAGCLALVLAALAAHALRGYRGEPAARPGWPIALVPVLGFALQEHLERLLAWGHLPLGTALEPTFALGLALQLPFAVAALLLARALTSAADTVGRVLARPLPAASCRPSAGTRLAVDAVLPRVPARALGGSQRGPPA
jgi:hypothetical protein